MWCTSIAGTRHVNVTDDAVLYLAPPLRNLLALGSIDGARGLTVQNADVAAFLNHALLQPPPGTVLVPVGANPEALALCGPS